MKFLILVPALSFVSVFAFAVGDPAQNMTADVMSSEVTLYKAAIADTDCKDLVPVSGVITGGGMPGFEAHYETMQMAPTSSAAATAQLTMSWITESRSNKKTVSFECLQK